MVTPVTIIHVDTERTWRGGEAQVLHLANRLDKNRFYSIIAAPPKSALLDRAIEQKIPVIQLLDPGEISPRMIWTLMKACRQYNARLLHVHTSHGLIGAGLCRQFMSSHPRVIYSRRTDFHLRTRMANLSLRKYLWGADHIISVSNGIRNVLISDGIPSERITTIYSGIDVNRFIADDPGTRVREECGIRPDQPVIGMIAALAPHKDPMTFFRAAEIVGDRFPDTVFLLAGVGKLWDNLSQTRQSSSIHSRFHMLGFRTDIPDVLAAMDIFCISSTEEGLCTSILDAMAMAKPVVATNVGGIPEAVTDGETGILVTPQSPAVFAEALIALLNHPDHAQQMGLAGRKKVENIFSADQTARKTETVYQTILQTM